MGTLTYAVARRYHVPVQRERGTQWANGWGSERGSELAVSFPLFCAWVHELQPESSPAEEIQRVADKLRPIILRRLPDPDYFQDCRNDVFMFLEKKLGGPMEFAVKVFRMDPGCSNMQPHPVKVMHLLRVDAFAIMAHHQDFLPFHRFRAQLMDFGESGKVAAKSDLSCGEDGRVCVRFPYDTLQHEQAAMLDLLPDATASVRYYSGVKAVRHESFDVRIGFVVATARLLARNRAWKESETRNREVSLEDMSVIPETRQNGADDRSADILARKAVGSLPPKLRDQLHQHYVKGVPWATIAERYHMKDEVLRKHASRALNEIAESIVGEHPGAAKGAVERVAKWLQEMLPRVWPRG